MDSLELFLRNADISPLGERLKVLQEIQSVADRLTCAALKCLLGQLARSQCVYRDKLSRQCVQDTVKAILVLHPRDGPVLLQRTIHVIRKEISENAYQVTLAMDMLGLCAMALQAMEASNDGWQDLVLSTAVMCSHIAMFGKRSHKLFAEKHIRRVLKCDDILTSLVTMETTPHQLALYGLLVGSCHLRVSDKMVESLLSQTVNVKKVPKTQLVECSLPLCRAISWEVFEKQVHPSVRRMLLRNPELVLPSVTMLLRALPFDINAVALEMSKTLFPLLESSHESLRKDTIALLAVIVQKCSSADAHSDLLSLAKERLCNSKRLTPSQRVVHVEAHGQMSLLKLVTDSSAQQAMEDLAKTLQNEAHEGVLVAAMESLRRWCIVTDSRTLPKPAVAFSIKAAAGSSVVKTAVYDMLRHANIQCFLLEGHSLFDHMLKGGAESVLLAVIVAQNRSCFNSVVVSQLEDLVNTNHFTAEKMMTSAPPSVLCGLVELVLAVLREDIADIATADRASWLSCAVRLLTSARWEIRRHAQLSLKPVFEADPSVLLPLLEQLGNQTASEQVSGVAAKECLQWICRLTLQDKVLVAKRVFPLANLKTVVQAQRGLWAALLKRLGLSVADFVESHIGFLLQSSLEHSEEGLLRLKCLLDVYSEVAVFPVVVEMIEVIKRIESLGVSQKEVEILNTSPTQLQDRALYNELVNKIIGKSVGNVKRESKLYSVADQKWEVEMKAEKMRKKVEELEANNAGIGELLQLAKSDKSLVATVQERMAYEEKVRADLKIVCCEADWMVQCLSTLLDCCKDLPEVPGLPKLASALLSALDTPLLSVRLQQVWVKLTQCTFQQASSRANGELLGWLTLQLLIPSVGRLRSWSSSALPPAIDHLLEVLTSEAGTSVGWMLAAFPLLERLVKDKSLGDTSFSTKAIHLFYLCSLKLNTASPGDLEIFPVAQVLSLLMEVMLSSDASLMQGSTQRELVECQFNLCKALADVALPESVLETLIKGLSSPNETIKLTTLKNLSQFEGNLNSENIQLVAWMHICCHDSHEDVASLANSLWLRCFLRLTEPVVPLVMDVVCSKRLDLHRAAAEALEVLLQEGLEQSEQAVDMLLQHYRHLYKDISPLRDEVGRVIGNPPPDEWEGRVGVATALKQIAAHFSKSDCMSVLDFMVPQGLGDRHSEVRSALLNAALLLLDIHGKDMADNLMATFEKFLKKVKVQEDTSMDAVRQSVMVLMGTLAKHLEKEDPKVCFIVHQLLQNLDTPSQSVQEAISGCLVPLVPSVREEAEEILRGLLDKLFETKSFAERKGAAYGIAGMVKGLGIPSLKQFSIMSSLKVALENKKNYRHREGSLFAIEQLTVALGRLFEPYVVHLLPNLLQCFGDGNQYVREATIEASKAIMGRLSGHGVKLILPDLLKGLEDDSWRTKAGSAELLGAMAYCAPKQLSSCLPGIVPRLSLVLTDSHIKVQGAGMEALKKIGSVIKNPEIQLLVPKLLLALSDPSAEVNQCLQSLLDTQFVHMLDAPSLALIMPILQQALSLRSSESKKMAAQIIGNMYSLTEQKDLSPYMIGVLPGLKEALVDPVPEVRGSAARALGAMVKGLGEEAITDLLPWLFSMLQSEGSSVDRSGAAQGLAEVIRAQGKEHLHAVMPKFVEAAMNTGASPQVRDGYLLLFVYLPLSFGEDFTSYIGTVLPCILQGLADESEFVRDTSLRAAQGIVQRYADSALEWFLPELQKGVTDPNWRIRYSSIQLLGDLLFCISGLSGKMSTVSEEDENFGTEEAKHIIIEKLGYERRNVILSRLYIGRSDVALLVRQISLHVWKVIVTNTPRTLREILPQLFQLVLQALTSDVHDRRQVGARTLGDLVRKLGDRVLPEVIPILEGRLQSGSDDQRQGVCIGLSEIIKCTDPDSVTEYAQSILAQISQALIDPVAGVRIAASETFSSLHTSLGNRVLDSVMPFLLESMNTPEKSEFALDALKQTMKLKNKVLMPYLLPKLIAPPVNTKALAALSSVAGDALLKGLPKMVAALTEALEEDQQPETWLSCRQVVLNACQPTCAAEVIQQLCKQTHHEVVSRRQAAMKLLRVLSEEGNVTATEDFQSLIEFLIKSLMDPDDMVVDTAWDALSAVVKRQDTQTFPSFIAPIYSSTKYLAHQLNGGELHGFSRKGIDPVLSVLKETLFKGSQEEREQAALSLTFVIKMTSVSILTSKTNVIQIAGPLIRLVGDKYGSNVKVPTLEALTELIERVGTSAKAIFPQLQTSYIKALAENTPTVRERAKGGLIKMVDYVLRIDPIFNELHKGVKTYENPTIRATLLETLYQVSVRKATSVSQKILIEIKTTLLGLITSSLGSPHLEAGKVLGIICQALPEEDVKSVLAASTVGSSDIAELQTHFSVISQLLEYCFDKIKKLGFQGKVEKMILNNLKSEKLEILLPAINCSTKCFPVSPEIQKDLIEWFKRFFIHEVFDVRAAICESCGYLATHSDASPEVAYIVAMLFRARKDRNTMVRTKAMDTLRTLPVSVLESCKNQLDEVEFPDLEHFIKFIFQ